MRIELTKQNLFIIIFLIFVIAVLPIILISLNSMKSKSEDESDLANDSHSHIHLTIVNSDKSFLIEMIPHHIEAVETSEYIIKNSKNEELIEFAKHVVKDQQIEISDMTNWFRELYPKDDLDTSGYEPMMSDLTKFKGDELDKAYIEGMISHHAGAVTMSEQILRISENEKIRELADKIINVQNAEIESLKDLLAKY